MKNKVDFEVQINNKVIFEMSEKINHKKLRETVIKIEKILLENNVKRGKIKSIYELTIEILQNIINYSYDNEEYKSNFKIMYSTIDDQYTIESSNFIKGNQKIIIQDRIKNIVTKDSNELRKMIREKMRTKEDQHKKGAGLGFIVMARKSSKQLEIAFEDTHNELIKFNLIVFV